MADELETLTLVADQPLSKSGKVGLLMRHTSGGDDEFQWFEYKPSFMAPDIVRVSWDRDTMAAVIDADVAAYLLRNNYARLMTKAEVSAYNLRVEEALATGEPDDSESPVQPNVRSKRRDRDGDAAVLPVSPTGTIKGKDTG